MFLPKDIVAPYSMVGKGALCDRGAREVKVLVIVISSPITVSFRVGRHFVS